MAVPPAPGDSAGVTSSDHDDPTSQAPAFRLVLLCALVVVLLVSLGTSIWLVTTRGAEPIGITGGASQVQQERETVMSQSRQLEALGSKLIIRRRPFALSRKRREAPMLFLACA